jgi:thymidylate synthase ThyX
MSYGAKILKDSISYEGHRLTTFEVTFPRIVLAEFNTHRVFSRNSASSRAIPVSKMLARVVEDPFIPTYWGKNQKGMQAVEELSPEAQTRACSEWLLARDNAVAVVKRLQMPDIDLHKQIANRLLEPWLWHTVIVTGTEWINFFALRDNKMAQPEISTPARMMRQFYETAKPEKPYKGWHLPLVFDEDKEEVFAKCESSDAALEMLVKISCARCARVSYLTHDGKRDLSEDIALHDKLLVSGHMSPLEHAARVRNDQTEPLMVGNFRGWVQHRKMIRGEAVFTGGA